MNKKDMIDAIILSIILESVLEDEETMRKMIEEIESAGKIMKDSLRAISGLDTIQKEGNSEDESL